MTNGRLLTIVGTDPGAGVEVAEVVPAGEIWELQSFHFTLTTDGTVLNRVVRVNFTDGTSIILSTGGNFPHPASNVVTYQCAAFGLVGPLTSNNAVRAVPIPPGFLLYPGFTLATLTGNLQAGDDFTFPIMSVLVRG